MRRDEEQTNETIPEPFKMIGEENSEPLDSIKSTENDSVNEKNMPALDHEKETGKEEENNEIKEQMVE